MLPRLELAFGAPNICAATDLPAERLMRQKTGRWSTPCSVRMWLVLLLSFLPSTFGGAAYPPPLPADAPSAPPDYTPFPMWFEPCLHEPYLGYTCSIIGARLASRRESCVASSLVARARPLTTWFQSNGVPALTRTSRRFLYRQAFLFLVHPRRLRFKREAAGAQRSWLSCCHLPTPFHVLLRSQSASVPTSFVDGLCRSKRSRHRASSWTRRATARAMASGSTCTRACMESLYQPPYATTIWIRAGQMRPEQRTGAIDLVRRKHA